MSYASYLCTEVLTEVFFLFVNMPYSEFFNPLLRQDTCLWEQGCGLSWGWYVHVCYRPNLIQVEIFSPTIGDKIVEALCSIRVQRVTIESKRIHTPPPPLHSKLWCLLFSIASLGKKALFSPLEVSKESESPFRAVSRLILRPIVQL